MRILQITERFDSFGVTDVCYHVSRELVKRDHEVTLIASDFELRDDITRRLNSSGAHVIPFHCTIALKSFFFTPSMKKWLDDNVRDFDIVHLHQFRSYQNVIAERYAKRHRIPYVVQAHGSALPFFQKRMLKRFYDLLWGQTVIDYAARFIALTALEKAQYQDMGIDAHKITIIPNGIERKKYEALPRRSEFRSKHAIAEDELVILFLGRLHKIKGVDLLVKAFAQLRKEMDGVKLAIAGPDAGACRLLRTMVLELGLSESVVFTGPLYGQDKLNAYVDADVYVLPSVFEAFPVTVLEAFACGTPVIVSDVCGIADMVEEFGCAVKRDTDRMCSALYNILRDDTFRKVLGQRARQSVMEELAWDTIIQDLEATYRNIIRSK